MQKTSIKRLLAISLVSGVLAASSNAVFAQNSTVKRVGAGSTDGDRTSYHVSCTNGSDGTVYVNDRKSKSGKRAKICAIALGGKARCSAKWSIDRASEHACKVAAR